MAKITIDGKEYDMEELSAEARGQIASIRFVDQKIADLQSQIAVLKTARIAYQQGLSNTLRKSNEEGGDDPENSQPQNASESETETANEPS